MYKYIYHIADLHIKSTDEYNNFKELYRACRQLVKQISCPDESLIVIAGDIFHSKTKFSTPLFSAFIRIINILTDKCKVILIFGNHDSSHLNMKKDIKYTIINYLDIENLYFLTEEKEYEFDNIIFIPTLFYSNKVATMNYKILPKTNLKIKSNDQDKQYEQNDLNNFNNDELTTTTIKNEPIDLNAIINSNSIVDQYDYQRLKNIDNQGSLFINDSYETEILNTDRIYIKDPNKIYISIYHNEIYGVKLNANQISSYNVKKSHFKCFDLILLGHIHNHQFLGDNIAYSGSLIQQQFDEPINNQGYILWDLTTKTGKFVKLEQKTSYITVTSDNYKTYKYPPNSYIKYIFTAGPSQQEVIEYIRLHTNIKKFSAFQQYEIVNTQLNNIKNNLLISCNEDIIHLVENQLTLNNINDKNIINILRDILTEINFSFNVIPKNITLNKLMFNNTMSYGEKNNINFNNFKGIIGLVAPNFYGKSSIIDILLYSIYRENIRGLRNNIKNINKSHFNTTINFDINKGDKSINYEIIRMNKLFKNRVKTTYSYQITKNNKLQSISKDNEKEYMVNEITDIQNFINASIILQKNQGFLDISARDRRNKLFSIFNFDIFDIIMRNINRKKSYLTSIINNKKTSIQKYVNNHKEINDYTLDNIKIKKKEILKQIDDIEEDIENLNNYLENRIIKKTSGNVLISKQVFIENKKNKIKLLNQITKQKDFIKKLDTEIQQYILINTIQPIDNNKNITEDEFNDIPNKIEILKNTLNNNLIKYNELVKNNILYKQKLIDNKQHNKLIDILNSTNDIDIIINKLKHFEQLDNKNSDDKLSDAQHQYEYYKNIYFNNENKIRTINDNINKYNNIIYDIDKRIEKEPELKYYYLKIKNKQDDNIKNGSDINSKINSYNIKHNSSPLTNQIAIKYYNDNINVLKHLNQYINYAKIKKYNYDPNCQYCVSNNIEQINDLNEKSPDVIKLPNNDIINNLIIVRKYLNLLNNIYFKPLQTIDININNIFKYYFNMRKLKKHKIALQNKIILCRNKLKTYSETQEQTQIKMMYYENITFYNSLKKEQLLKNQNDDINLQIQELRNDKQIFINNNYNLKCKLLNDENNKLIILQNKLELLTNDQIYYTNNKINIMREKLKNNTKKLKDYNDIIKQLDTIKQHIKFYNEQIQELKSYENKQQNNKILENLFKEDGTLSSHINSMIKIIEIEVNNILHELTNFSIKIIYDLKSGIVIERILNKGKSINAQQMSGFEKEIVDIVFKIVLNKFNTKFKSDFLIIDEGFTSYDTHHINNIRNLIDLLKSNYKFVLIISHIDTLKDIFDKTITITKNDDNNSFIDC